MAATMPYTCTGDLLVNQPASGLFANLLDAVKPALVAAEGEWRQVELSEAPTFRTLSLLGPDENCLSDIIAELLDPHGSHGQAAAFLTLFTSRCGTIGRLTNNHVSIHRESCTVFIANQKRRMDILVDGGNWGIGIENKPWAGEQKNQLQDYAEDLEKRYGGNFLLIRLTGRDVEVQSLDALRQGQLSRQGKFASWRYDADLLAWVNECKQCCQALRVTNFLDEFARYITTEFGPATNPRAAMERKHLLPALESVLKKDPGQLHTAAAIAELFPEVRQRYIDHLFDEVQEDVLGKLGANWEVNRSEEDFVETEWAKFAFAHKDWEALYWVMLESQPRYHAVVLGVWHDPGKGIERNDQIAQELRRLGWGKKGGGPFWEAHSPLPDPFTNWATLSGIGAIVKQRAELKRLLVDEFVRLCRHFEVPLAKLAKEAARKQ